MSNDLQNLLLTLETQVYKPEIRRSAELSSALFAEDFVEFGGNGAIYDKAGIVAALVASPEMGGRPVIEEFAVRELSGEVALATYRLKLLDEAGNVTRQSLRSTIYKLIRGNWQQVFHQVTKVDSIS